eukprot:gene7537-5316_t
MRTFVFISNIPQFLLQPLSSEEEGLSLGPRGQHAFRHPAYERLRRLLVNHSSGVMLVMHLGNKGFGLALYASEEEALAACQACIYPDGNERSKPTSEMQPLRLRILEKDKPLLPEAVYCPTITVEGETVLKSDLASTRGLELAYRAKSVPKWCPQTKNGQDCHFGSACHKIHRAAFQRTVRKRPRELVDDSMSHEETIAVQQLLEGSLIDDSLFTALVPPSLRLMKSSADADPHSKCITVPLTPQEIRDWLLPTCCAGSVEEPEAKEVLAVEKGITQRMTDAAMKADVTSCVTGNGGQLKSRYFFRVTCPGGSPWDWGLCDEEVGLPTLRGRCPFPENGAPTPLERDQLSQKVWYWLNQMNGFTHVKDGIAAIRRSTKVREAVRQWVLKQDDGKLHFDRPLCVKMMPWVYLPTVACECSFFVREAGEGKSRGLAQRRGQLRIMTSRGLLTRLLRNEPREVLQSDQGYIAAVDHALSRIAVLGRGEDQEAEQLMEEELRRYGQQYTDAADLIRRHLRRLCARTPCSENGEDRCGDGTGGDLSLPATAALTVHFAMRSLEDGGADGPIVLSLDTYRDGLEKCTLSNRLIEGGGGEGLGGVEWNTTRHDYEPLFSRDALVRLRSPSIVVTESQQFHPLHLIDNAEQHVTHEDIYISLSSTSSNLFPLLIISSRSIAPLLETNNGEGHHTKSTRERSTFAFFCFLASERSKDLKSIALQHKRCLGFSFPRLFSGGRYVRSDHLVSQHLFLFVGWGLLAATEHHFSPEEPTKTSLSLCLRAQGAQIPLQRRTCAHERTHLVPPPSTTMRRNGVMAAKKAVREPLFGALGPYVAQGTAREMPPTCPFPLPPPLPENAGKHTLFLDIDQTLLQTFGEEYTTIPKSESQDDPLAGVRLCKYHYVARPYLREFLEEVRELFEVVIWTSANEEYCAAIVDSLEREILGLPVERAKVLKGGQATTHLNFYALSLNQSLLGMGYMKYIPLSGREEASSVLIDDNVHHFRLTPRCVVKIAPFSPHIRVVPRVWMPDQELEWKLAVERVKDDEGVRKARGDTALRDIMPLLRAVAKVPKGGDVRRELDHWRVPEYTKYDNFGDRYFYSSTHRDLLGMVTPTRHSTPIPPSEGYTGERCVGGGRLTV